MALLEKPHRILFILVGIFLEISTVILAAPVIESYATQFSNGGEEEVAFPGRGSTSPDFELFTLTGNTVNLSDYHDLPVLINFWATSCGPCVLEMPLIEERHRRYSQELVVWSQC